MNPSYRIVVAAYSVLLATSLAGCDRFRSADSFYERGQQQNEKGNFRAALGDYRSAIERDGKHARARLAMARVMYFLGDFEGALTSVDFGIGGGAGAEAEAIKLRYEILTSMNRFDDILKTIGSETALSDSQKAFISARAHGGLGHGDEAFAQLTKALELDPRDVRARTLMAIVTRERYNTAEAEKALDQLVAENESDAEVRLARGRLALSVGDLKLAKISLESAEQLGRTTLNWPTQAQLYALLTEVAIAERDQEAATKYLGGFKNRSGSSAIASYLTARVSLLKNDVDAAVAELQKSVARIEYPPSQLLLANLQLSRANYGAAESLLGPLLAKNPNNVEVRKLVAQLYLATNRATDARKLLGSEAQTAGAAEEKTDPQLAWLQGQTMIATGAQAAGVDLLEKAVAANPSDVAKGVQLARLYLMLGRAEKAKTLLEALPGPADAQRQSLVVLANISGKNWDEATKQIDSLLARNPKDTNLHVAAGGILTRLGDGPRAIELFKKAIELDAKNAEAKLALASVLAATKQLDAADEQLRGVIALDSRNAAAYVGLANTAFARGNQPESMKYLEQAIGADPAVIQPRLQLAMLALRAQDTERAKGLLDQAITVGNNRHEIINAAGLILQQAQRYDDALILFDRAGAAGNEEAPLHAARVQVALGRKEDARRRLSALTNGGKLQLAAITSLAALDVEEGKADAGVARLNPLRTRKELAPQLDEIEGDLYFQAKNVAKAQAAYDRAIAAKPSQRLTVKRFRLLVGTDPSAAVQGLQSWLKSAPKDTLVRKELGLYYVQKEMNEKALVEFETLHREGGASDPEVLNNFAWLLGNKRDPRALALARDAYRLDPNRPEIGDTYGWLLLDANNVKEALQVLEKAAAAAVNSQEIQYHYAVAHARDGNQAKAKALLQSILNTKAKFAQRDEAERLLKSLN